MTVYLTPLRERIQELPSLSSLYLNTLNLDLAKQIIGFTPDAFELLTKYDWPDNYSQFQKVLYELAVITDTPYINEKNVRYVLEKEAKIYMLNKTAQKDNNEMKDAADRIDNSCSKTLEEISSNAIMQVLEKCNGNQSMAAKKLGISRTTLWRYLNKS